MLTILPKACYWFQNIFQNNGKNGVFFSLQDLSDQFRIEGFEKVNIKFRTAG